MGWLDKYQDGGKASSFNISDVVGLPITDQFNPYPSVNGPMDITPKLVRLADIERPFKERYNKERRDIRDAEKYDFDSTINLTSGRFRGAKVPNWIIDDSIEAAKRNNYPVGNLLALIGRESTFGSYVDRSFPDMSKQVLVSGWDITDKYAPYNSVRFLADHKVPGIREKRSHRGFEYDISDRDAVEKYLGGNPEILEKYRKKISETPSMEGKDFFDLAIEKIKKEGLKAYNPGDPDYENKVRKDYELLKGDSALQRYLRKKNVQFQNGGNVQMKNQLVNVDQLTNFTNYNRKMESGGWLDKYSGYE